MLRSTPATQAVRWSTKAVTLVGINTAILSRTGSYTGYAFAIPVDIAKKVFDDLVKYRHRTKSVLTAAVWWTTITSTLKSMTLTTTLKTSTVYCSSSSTKKGPRHRAGLEAGRCHYRGEQRTGKQQSAFEEELSYTATPATRLPFTYVRDDKHYTAPLTLVNRRRHRRSDQTQDLQPLLTWAHSWKPHSMA